MKSLPALNARKVKNLSSTRFELLHKLHTETGVKNISYPIPTKDGALGIEVGSYASVLFNFIDGKTALEAEFSDKQYTALGKLLGRVHQSKVDYQIKEDFSIPSKDDFLKITSLLTKKPNGASTIEAWQLLSPSKDKIVVCHGEPSPGNIVVDKKGEVYLIDWDEPIFAPKEKDLMFFEKTMKPFMSGYSAHSRDTTINDNVKAFYSHLWNINEVTDFGDRLLLNPGTEEENKHNLEGLKHFLDYSGLGQK